MKKINILLAAVLMVFATISLSAQTKTCSMSNMTIEECAAKLGVSVEEAQKICGAKASTRVASASAERIVDLPTCCYNSLTANGKACCDKYQSELASADKLIDAEGNEFKKCAKTGKSCAKSCASKSSSKTQVASVVMVREIEDAKPVKATSKKSCSRTCASKTTKA